MKKTLKHIFMTVILLGIICVVFVKIGWLTSANEVGTMFVIAVVVISIDILCSWLWRKMKSSTRKGG